MTQLTLARFMKAWGTPNGVRAIKSKESSRVQRFIGWFLKWTRINDRYLTGHWSAIGRTIWVTNDETLKEIESGHLSVNYLRLLVHETEHVIQYRRSPVKFLWRYLLRQGYRAGYEAEATAMGSQILYVYGRDVSNRHNSFAQQLQTGYGVDRHTARIAAGHVRSKCFFMAKFGTPVSLGLEQALVRHGVPRVRAQR